MLQILGTIRIMGRCWQAVVTRRVHVPGGPDLADSRKRVSGSWQLLEFGGFRLLSNKGSHPISRLLWRIGGLIESLMKENR